MASNKKENILINDEEIESIEDEEVQDSSQHLNEEKKEEKIEEEIVDNNIKKTKKRKKFTINNIRSIVIDLENFIRTELEKEKTEASIRFVKSILKKIKIINKQLERTSIKSKGVKKTDYKSGILLPFGITNELADFLNIPHDERISRVNVTRKICKYIKDNNLKNPKNGKEIILDDTLKNLLKYDEEKHGKFYYCTIQQLIQQHFIKEKKEK